MTSLIHPCQKRAVIPLKFGVVFNYDTFFKVAQCYPHGPKLAQLTVLKYIFLIRSNLRSQGVKKGQIFPKSGYFLRK